MAFCHHLTSHFYTICFLLSWLTITPTLGANIETDKAALISIKSHITTQPSNSLSTWDDQDPSPCNWTRVSCNKGGKRVVALDLSGLQITGTLSPHIGNLSFLRSLQLQNNKFTGKIPDSLGNLFRLRTFNMSFNNIQGGIPTNMSRCKALTLIDFMQNELSGPIPEELTRLTNLQVLVLARNHLSGPIPPSIGNLSSLTTLNLGTNEINMTIPSDLARIRSLKHLDLTINNLTGTIPPSIYNMSSLESLAVAFNDLWGDLPSNVGATLPNLLVFNFCINRFTGTIPASLHNLTNIRIIRMAHNHLHGTVPPGLGNLPELVMYNIGYNNIVGSSDDGLGFLTSLANSTKLHFLAIDGNGFGGVIPDSIGNLSKQLNNLYMGENRFSGSIPASIGQLSSLGLLNLSYNSISGEIPTEIGQLGKLEVLLLDENRLSGKVPNSLGDLQNLNEIDLSGNELEGSIPPSLGNLEKLLAMDFSNNRLNGSVPVEILRLRSLSAILNLSSNSLTGPLPQEIGLLDRVVTIDLSNNRLSGSIPNSIGNCKSLEELFISTNSLSGNVPSALGEVRGLTTLDLSSNQLSGSVPIELENLKDLQFLNLSFNNLEGVVPRNGIFSNHSRVDLEGNPRLCPGLKCKRGHLSHKAVVIFIVFATMLALLSAIGLFLFFYWRNKTKIVASSDQDSFKGQHRVVTYDELRLATGNFNRENLLGRGSFGSVYKGSLREGTEIAVKVLDIETTGSRKSFIAECAALKHVRHRNLVKLITSCSSVDRNNMEFLALVYEFMKNGSLQDWIETKRNETNGERIMGFLDRLNVGIDVASGLNYLHHECVAPVVHCDLKPSNVLLDEDMTAKIGDFGLATLLIERTRSINSLNALKGSIGYIPPEYGVGAKPSMAGDVYSYGVMLLEIFTGKSPTHEDFAGGRSLKKWVQVAFPAKIEAVVDPRLLLQPQELCTDHDASTMCHDRQRLMDYITKVIGIALSCTNDSPDGRITIRDALHKLVDVRMSFSNVIAHS